jgi:hypothetical protein
MMVHCGVAIGSLKPPFQTIILFTWELNLHGDCSNVSPAAAAAVGACTTAVFN